MSHFYKLYDISSQGKQIEKITKEKPSSKFSTLDTERRNFFIKVQKIQNDRMENLPDIFALEKIKNKNKKISSNKKKISNIIPKRHIVLNII